MIEAKRNSAALALFERYLNTTMRRHFNRVSLIGEGHKALNFSKPLLMLPNHSSWWDGFWVHLMINAIQPKADLHVMMTEKELQRFPFLKYLGAYSINHESKSDILRSIRYSTGLLQQNKIVCLFPQGKMQYWSNPEWHFEEGFLSILKRAPENTQILPMIFYTQHEGNELPVLYVKIGQTISNKAMPAVIFDSYVTEMDLLRHNISADIERPNHKRDIWQGARPFHERWHSFKKRFGGH
jgi:1-acyl-sn-glycerol-3-phosphate acyltransferase